MVYKPIEGASVSIIWAVTEWRPEMKNKDTLQQITDLKNFFILKGIYTESMNLFISRKGNVFINQAYGYTFTGKPLRRSLKQTTELYFDKIIRNIERKSSEAFFELNQQKEENQNEEQLDQTAPINDISRFLKDPLAYEKKENSNQNFRQ